MSNETNQIGELIKEEKELIREIKKEEKELKKMGKNVWVLNILIGLIIIGVVSGIAYWAISRGQIGTDNAHIYAPQINLAPQGTGILQEVMVREGDIVTENTIVARVGDELIKTQVGGIITSVQNNVGKIFSHGETVVSMYDQNELRVVGQFDEDKGLSDIRIGQLATFTVDAFGAKQYEGIVDEISETAHQGDVVFNISDKRETKQFDVKIYFNKDQYPELKNGMSAKLLIYK
jgi:multidrug resistance efflux pump